jgi:hypothetical protein
MRVNIQQKGGTLHALYVKNHRRVYDEKGKASEYECECGAQAEHWHDTTLSEVGSPDPDDYVPLCRSCHRNAHNKPEVKSWAWKAARASKGRQ